MSRSQVLLDFRPIAHRFVPLHRWMIRSTQFAIFLFAGISAFLLRFDFVIPSSFQRHMLVALAIWAFFKIAVFHFFALDRGWWSYTSVHDVLRLLVGNTIAGSAACVAILLLGPPGFPRSIYLLDCLLCFTMTAGIRLAVRIISEISRARTPASRKRTLIYGAGEAGISLLREIHRNSTLAYEVIGFIDDDPTKAGRRIHESPIFGPGAALTPIVRKYDIEMILIALPSATGVEMTRILNHCAQAGVSYKTIPGLAEVIESGGIASQIRDVAVEDLLGRAPVRLEEDRIRAALTGKVVVVTGAAGSIGSELCRQIARFQPAAIVGFEIAESPLFEIDREMRQLFPGVPFHPEIGSVQNRARIHEVLAQYRPSVVYHAAAYKHVPLMETHIFEAIENNVFGTYNLAAAAADHGVDDFVMISSDKAVRPTNVMGATKRVTELLLLALQNGRTKYVAVRFGNVLGSNGSVIPIFKKQIAAGGPVTVTHPEMRRFFMTIPEACQLVLQAGVVGEGGEICVLDMGEPVKIVDLARNLILLSGLRPGQDVKIEFTGIRPGEKLFEELNTMLEDTAPTSHEKIRIFVGSGVLDGDLLDRLEALNDVCQARDAARLVLLLKEIVLDYSPSTHLLKRIIEPQERYANSLAALVRATVTAADQRVPEPHV